MAADAAAETDQAVAPEPEPEPAPVPAGSRLPLALRLFLLTALPLVLAVGSAMLVTWLVGDRIARESVASALDHGAQAQRALVEQRLRLLELRSRQLAGDPALASAFAAIQGRELDLAGTPPAVQVPLREMLLERRSQSGFDLGLVLDAGGRVLAGTDPADAVGGSLADDPLVARALAERTPASGFWRHDDLLYQAAIVPLAPGSPAIGHLLLARRVDDQLGRDIARGSHAEFAWWLPGAAEGPRLAASSFAEEQAALLAARFADTPELVDALQLGHPVDGLSLQVGDQRWLLRAKPTVAGEAGLGLVTTLASATAAAGAYQQILGRVLLAGIVSLVLALLLSLWLSRRILRPVTQLADAAGRAAAGDYQARPVVAGQGALSRLGFALDALLSDLREKRDLEQYVAATSRLLPDPQEAESGPPPPAREPAPVARQDQCVLLALELPAAIGADAQAAAAAAGDLAGRLQALARRCGGRVAGGDGERWLLAFDGAGRLPRALQAARAVVRELGSEALRPTAALAEGETLEAVLQLEHAQLPVLLGTAGRQLLRLLCESAAGRVLVARPLGERIRAEFGADALEVAIGALAGRRYYALRQGGLAGLSEPDPEAADPASRTGAPPAAGAGAHGDPPQPGDCLGGRYEILSRLGAGATGIIYKARDLELADVVALKLLHPAVLADGGQREQLRDDIGLARRIVHPNVVRTLDLVELDGRTAVAMEYVRGFTLRALLKQSGPLPYPAGLRIARQLCAALEAVHAAGLLHRDLNPGKLVLEAGGNARLAGLGFARGIRREPSGQGLPGVSVGSPQYSPPEQLAGEALDERADIYSCGVVMSEMFCGGLPYAGRSAMELYLAQVQQEPLRPSASWPEIPPALERLILRSIARRREDRFQDAAELGAALAELRA